MKSEAVDTPRTRRSELFRIALKALLLLLVINVLFVFVAPGAVINRLSLYNWLFPGRTRLPYGDNPSRAYNLTMDSLEAMLASHEISGGAKRAGEFRVLLVGDSAAWGFLLPAGATTSAWMNQAQTTLRDGRKIRVYNLGYPVMSLTKDLLLLTEGVRYRPDLILWLFTLESFPYDKQLFSPLLQQNPRQVKSLIERYQLPFEKEAAALSEPSFLAQTLVGQRRALADWVRLQVFGVMWAATGVDQEIPERYTPPQEDLSAELNFHNLTPPHLTEADLALPVLVAGDRAVGDTPILFVNEPMFISQGKNSELRYNFYYPRWAYDDYRQILAEYSQAQKWAYLDLWDLIPPEEFTNSAVHLSPRGAELLAQRLLQAIGEMAR